MFRLSALDGCFSIENREASFRALSPAEARLGLSRGPGVQRRAKALRWRSPGLTPAKAGVALVAAEGYIRGGRIGGVLASCGSRAKLSRSWALQPRIESTLLRRSLWRPTKNLRLGLKPESRFLDGLELALLSGGPRPGQQPPCLARAKALAREAVPPTFAASNVALGHCRLKPAMPEAGKASLGLPFGCAPKGATSAGARGSLGAAYASMGRGQDLEGPDLLPMRPWHRAGLKPSSSMGRRAKARLKAGVASRLKPASSFNGRYPSSLMPAGGRHQGGGIA